ncbi:MAG: zinc-ribbon domain-containing protein [Faecousia sp.]
MAMIVCPSCGKYINGDEAFCPYCGTLTKPEKAQQNALQQQSAPQNAPQQQRTPQNAPQQPRQSAPQPQAVPVYTNPSYAPPVNAQQPAAPSYEFNGKTGKGMGWIVFMRVILWIIFAGMVIAGLVVGIEVFDRDEVMAIVYILGSVLSAFIIVAGGMIALNNATNLRSIAMNTAKTVELLQQIKRK